jgi:phage gpG-like protein
MSVTIKGIKKVNDVLRSVKLDVVDQKIPLKQVGVLLEREVDQYWQQGGNPYDGGTWKPNAPSTIAMKGSSKPLVFEGVLRASFSARVQGDNLIFGTPVEYAPQHQTGSGVPRRPFMPAEDRVLQLVDQTYNRYIAKLIR